MAKRGGPGGVQHWKHGWIPVSPEAKAYVAGKGPKPGLATKQRSDSNSRLRDIASRTRQRSLVAAGANDRDILFLRASSYAPSNPNSLGEQVKPDPTEMMAEARGGGRPYSADHMTSDGRFTPEREALHRQIIEDHLKGIKPTGKRPIQYMNGGGPGSGKSSMRTGDNGKLTGYPPTREADEMTGELDLSQPAGAALIDPDAIKMMLPEVKAARAAGDDTWAGKSHEESSYLAKRIHAAALDRGIDLVYDGTGDSGARKVEQKINLARQKGYQVEGNYVYLDPQEGMRRAAIRGQRMGRVVAPEVIEETYKDVSKTFGELADSGTFDVLRVFDNNKARGVAADVIAEIRPGSPDIRNPAAYRRFLGR